MSNPITASAARLRLFLFIAMGLALVAIIAIVIYGVRYLDSYAAEVNQTVYDSTTSNERLSAVRSQVEALEEHQSAVERAKQIVADSQSYIYQDVIIRDLQTFANRAGIRIINFDFVTEASESSTAATPEAAPVDPGAAPEGDPAAAGAEAAAPIEPVSQLNSTTVNITLDTPVDYRRLLQFIHYIEQNLTKMQISSVSLSNASEEQSGVTTDSLTIEVFIR